MRILTDESTGEKFEIHPAPHGGRYVEMVEAKKEPKRIDWGKGEQCVSCENASEVPNASI